MCTRMLRYKLYEEVLTYVAYHRLKILAGIKGLGCDDEDAERTVCTVARRNWLRMAALNMVKLMCVEDACCCRDVVCS